MRLDPVRKTPERARGTQLLDLIFEDNRLNVYAGELEARPPAALTTAEGSAVDGIATRLRTFLLTSESKGSRLPLGV